MTKQLVIGFSFCLGLFSAAVAQAETPAATGSMPDALQALGVTQADLVSEEDAHQVRGQGGDFIPFSQILQFEIAGGTAVGVTTLFEGVIGQFIFVNDKGHEVQATFGGVEGTIGSVDGNLVFQLSGKALQETFEFVGPFNQIFAQSFQRAGY